MEPVDPTADPQESSPRGKGPLDVRLVITETARDKLAAALAAPDGRDRWLRIFPQGIS
ncbi:MAG: hypothetical protein JRI23_27500 [Deltaproteobacteria bacterium]|jgi:hypothetical protein|nr:hypothetical protein [Deltaproteobacteria bacterium]MBW2535826.1 hypothetical protein [Deltaproteobacteria bacterium]